MAVVRYGPLVLSARGSLGSVVFARQGGTAIVRPRPMKVNQQSGRQLEVRANYARAVALWRGLGQADRDAWFRCAQIYKVVGPDGESKPMSAWVVFVTVALRMLDTPFACDTFWLTPNPVFGNLEYGTVRLDVWPGGPAQFVHSRGTIYDGSFTATVIMYSVFCQRVFRTLPGWPGHCWRKVFGDISIGYSNNVSEGFAAFGSWPGVGERIRWRVKSHYPAWPSGTVMQGFSTVPNVGPELVTNGDMELPVPPFGTPPSGWSILQNGTLSRVTTQPWGDDASAIWTRSAGAGNTFLKTGQDIDVSVAGTYVLRFAIRSVTGTAYNVLQLIKTGVWALSFSATPPAADGLWHEQEWSVVIPAGRTTCGLEFGSTLGQALEVQLDNVSLRRNL